MKEKITAELKEKWHEDPHNWILGFLYFNKNDHRVLVPKRNKFMGWTLNFASPYSYLVLAGITLCIGILANK